MRPRWVIEVPTRRISRADASLRGGLKSENEPHALGCATGAAPKQPDTEPLQARRFVFESSANRALEGLLGGPYIRIVTKLSLGLGACLLTAACATTAPPAEVVVWQNGETLVESRPSPEVDRALRSYAAEDYETAAEAFADAYAIEASPALLFAQAQALRLAGDCRRALPLYQRFLAYESDPTYVNAIAPLIDECLSSTGRGTTAMRDEP